MEEARLEERVHDCGRGLAAGLPGASALRHPLAAGERRLMQSLIGDPRLRAALFRFVDVRPACHSRADLVRHLTEFLQEAGSSSEAARRLAQLTGRPALSLPTASAAGLGVAAMARRFIAGEDAQAAAPELTALWEQGRCVTLDLLGEATLTEPEGERYAERCAQALRALAQMSAAWQPNELLEHDGLGRLPRANLSVKVSALTAHLRANAPERALAAARDRLLGLLRLARELGAHLHVDMESLDTRESITGLLLELLALEEFADGPSAGIVLQGYLTDAEEQLERLLRWVEQHPRATPFTIRLVKGAYWDHEVVLAAQHGWRAPVFTDRRACDRHYEHLTRRLLDARAGGLPLRPAIASHNLRSLAHAIAYSDALGLAPDALELQVLRGLGDDTAAAIAAYGRRVRVYSPVGDLVAGMAYLVRRLLENTSNDSFLAAQTAGADINLLLERP
jgi:proline dehydrogenase